MTVSIRRQRRVRTKAIPSYLVVAKSSGIDDVRLTLDLLPLCAHGRVIVVAEPGETVPNIEAPARMSVTVRTRGEEQSAADAARASVHAWASEMLCVDAVTLAAPHADPDTFSAAAPGMVAWVAGDDVAFTEELGQLLCEGSGLPAAALRVGSGFGAL